MQSMIVYALLVGTALAVIVPAYNYSEDPPATSVIPTELYCDYQAPVSLWNWDDLQNDVDGSDDVTVEIPCTLHIEDSVDGGVRENVMVKQRGENSRGADIKSYTIKFGNDNPRWRGLDRLLLKKDPYDKSMIRGKVAFDAYKTIPNCPSFRTNYMTLKVFITENGRVSEEDFGLYVNYEKGNDEWIERRGLQGDGNDAKDAWIYKVNGWDFTYNSDVRLISDSQYDKDTFELLLEAEANEDHTKLIIMMNEINDASDADFLTALNTHWDTDNLAMWVATNIACGDWDRTFRNHYIFSSPDSLQWHFIQWDSDKCMAQFDTRIHEHLSMSTWSDHFLFRRIMFAMGPEFIEMIDTHVVSLTTGDGIFKQENMEKLSENYGEVVSPYLGEGTVDHEVLGKQVWSEEEEIFYYQLNYNAEKWSDNMHLPLGIRYPNFLKRDNKYYLSFKSSISPLDVGLLHRVTIFSRVACTGNCNDDDYIRWANPEGILWQSDWTSALKMNEIQDLEFSPPNDVERSCYGQQDLCFVNIQALDSEGNLGPYGMEAVNFYPLNSRMTRRR